MGFQDSAKAKREAILAAIPDAWLIKDPIPSAADLRDATQYPRQFLTEQEIAITESDAEFIVQKTSTGQWKAEDVARAFAHRAAIAHQVTNCLHEVFFDAGIEDARRLDAYFAQNKRPIGPLHGLPVSLKDQFHVRGVETCMGYVGWIDTFEGLKGTGRERVYESEMVRELRNLGAVLYCKTSVPQTLMTGETINHIIGYTWNPKNRHLSSGGSSGGEGALIAMRGSVVGFGTDIGGSIRIPSAFCGQYGIRPSAGRMPYHGMANSMDGQNMILSVVGPLSSSVGGLRLAVKSILQEQPWLHDPMVHEIPWRPEQEQAVKSGPDQLAFGILRHDGLVTPFPPVSRAMEEVAQALEDAGNQIFDWKPPSHSEGAKLAGFAWTSDGGNNVFDTCDLSGETVFPQVQVTYGKGRQKPRTPTEIAAAVVKKREFQKNYMDYWNSTAQLTKSKRPADAFIMPVAHLPAARPEKYDGYTYTLPINALDYTSVVVPVTTANKDVDVVKGDHTPLSDMDTNFANYDPEIYDGAYVGVQIVCRRLQEEKALAIAEYVDAALKRRRQVTGSHL